MIILNFFYSFVNRMFSLPGMFLEKALPPEIACTCALGIPGKMMGSDLWIVRGTQFTNRY
jgi:hypothetical protein